MARSGSEWRGVAGWRGSGMHRVCVGTSRYKAGSGWLSGRSVWRVCAGRRCLCVVGGGVEGARESSASGSGGGGRGVRSERARRGVGRGEQTAVARVDGGGVGGARTIPTPPCVLRRRPRSLFFSRLLP